ncbi:MAG TPA: CDP-glucose 4,6-dehydratase [Nitrospirales bacterium]|jgi:CDP-glucose 4,6-dehydratase
MSVTNGSVDRNFWRGKRVFITGHTGFKGSWLSLWLTELGAVVRGYALAPETDPNLFSIIQLEKRVNHCVGDVTDRAGFTAAVSSFAPEIVFHLAAQPLVRRSYAEPVRTYETNVMGTVHLLEACRGLDQLKAIVLVTSDKVYENQERLSGYRENDRLGGRDPYSSSKACTELIAQSYRVSFLEAAGPGGPGVALASARSGNVIGGGDWSECRLVPDAVRAFTRCEPLEVRNPGSTRPWLHLIDTLRGYLVLAQALCASRDFAGSWNFGPPREGEWKVAALADGLVSEWGGGARWKNCSDPHKPYEAGQLSLDCSLAYDRLHWIPRIPLALGIALAVKWYRQYYEHPSDSRANSDLLVAQIEQDGMSQ